METEDLMGYAPKAVPEPQEILKAWLPFKQIDQVKAYEDENFLIPEAEPKEVLRFLMEQHGLNQEDLASCAPQSRIYDILSGRRSISKAIAKRLAQRFHVRADLFL